MILSPKQQATVIARLSMMRFFPSEPITHAVILDMIGRELCSTPDQAQWLLNELVTRVGTWPGPAEVRGLFCTRFRPADGIEADCSLPGYSPADGERQSERGEVRALSQAQAAKLLQGIR